MYNIPPEFEPDRQYERYCKRQEEELDWLMRNTRCKECNECVEPSGEFEHLKDQIAWCLNLNDFVNPDAFAIEYECEDVNV